MPLALYTDWKNVYVRLPTAEEQVTGAVLMQTEAVLATLVWLVDVDGRPLLRPWALNSRPPQRRLMPGG